MKLHFSIQLLCWLFSTSYLHAQTLVFEPVNLITMDSPQVLEEHRLIVRDGQIIAMEPVGQTLKVMADRIIDGQGHYLIPALTDSHFHQHSGEMEDVKQLFKLLIANGVTTVRSMAEWEGQDTIAIREMANHKDSLAPDYYTVGPQVKDHNADSIESAIELVRLHKRRGYDFLKIHGNLNKEVYLALLEEAERLGVRVVGHAQRHLPLPYSLRMTSIAHVEEFIALLSDEENLQIARFNGQSLMKLALQVKNSGIWVSPTLSILAMIPHYTDDDRFAALKQRPESVYISAGEYHWYTNPDSNTYNNGFFRKPEVKAYVHELIAATNKLTHAFYQAGVPLLAGSDNLGFHIAGFALHDEMARMQQAGLPPYEVLKAATVNSARYLGRFATAGSLSVGKNAGFVMLSANPLDDIRNSRTISGVMHKGQWLDRRALDQLLEEVKAARQAGFKVLSGAG
ncbi:amidohydrolase family protein [Bowmanella dokdonensis]|uniref:Amidohydrolase family protein n=1 Tax=Bowmanella dokdonensis TaxID=751969 RepID=A0A939IS95_9ALTE|nr:amidohydrolase family protein [Bowmanella dokdonensis]MBN7826949.1 amidohydrolase family protein [Bowmanella dokdonensis]